MKTGFEQADREILELCIEIFDAIPVARKARKVLKELGQTPGTYAGNGSHILAATASALIRKHIEENPDDLENPGVA